MKKQIFIAAIAGLLSFGALPSMAEEGGYFGIQYAQTTYEQSNAGAASNGEGDPKSIVFVGGYQFSEHIAVEGRYGVNGGDDTFAFTSGGANPIEVSHIVSLLGKFSVGGDVSPYLLVGFSDVELELSGGGLASNVAEGDSASFGAGIDVSVSETTAISLEYIQYIDADIAGGGDAELSAVSLGVNFKF